MAPRNRDLGTEVGTILFHFSSVGRGQERVAEIRLLHRRCSCRTAHAAMANGWPRLECLGSVIGPPGLCLRRRAA